MLFTPDAIDGWIDEPVSMSNFVGLFWPDRMVPILRCKAPHCGYTVIHLLPISLYLESNGAILSFEASFPEAASPLSFPSFCAYASFAVNLPGTSSFVASLWK